MLVATAFIASCDKDFEEVNTNPNDPISVPSGLMLGQIVRNVTNTLYINQYGGDMGACWSQQWGKVQYNDEARYIPREGSINAVWNNMYILVAEDADKMYQLAIEEENNATAGAALVMKAYAFLWLTDLYGGVPFTDALKGSEGIFTPAYDSQAAVYAGCYALLDEAESRLASGTGELSAIHDLLYSGDATKWAKFAASLKFRALMRNSKNTVTGDANAVEMQRLVDSGLLFSSTNEEAKLIYTSADPNANPIYESIVFGNRTEYRIGEVMVQHLDGTTGLPADNRLAVYAEPNTNGNYVGKPAGYTNLPNDTYNVNTISGIGSKYLEATAPGYLLGYTELQFLLAEAAYKGYINASPTAYYNSGIASSFAENGADITGYISGNVVLTPANALEQIATQKYIALYGQGFEAWTEWRRTGFPVLSAAVEGNLGSSIPTRLTYPALEQSLNGANWSAQTSTMTGGDKLDSTIDWM